MGIFDMIRSFFGDDEADKYQKDADDIMRIAYEEGDEYDEWDAVGQVPHSNPGEDDGEITTPPHDDPKPPDDRGGGGLLGWLFGR